MYTIYPKELLSRHYGNIFWHDFISPTLVSSFFFILL